jgi:hypothetical protein
MHVPTEVERLRRADCLAATALDHLDTRSSRSCDDLREAVTEYRQLCPSRSSDFDAVAPPDGAALICQERERQQQDDESYTVAHDDMHTDGALAHAAWAYLTEHPAFCSESGGDEPPDGWPWPADDWKPSASTVRNLTKAGALIAAEIDRIQRAAHAATVAPIPELDDIDPGDAA